MPCRYGWKRGDQTKYVFLSRYKKLSQHTRNANGRSYIHCSHLGISFNQASVYINSWNKILFTRSAFVHVEGKLVLVIFSSLVKPIWYYLNHWNLTSVSILLVKEAESGRKTDGCRVKITSPSPRGVRIISCFEIQERWKLNWLQHMTVTSMETAKHKQNRKTKHDATWRTSSSVPLVLHPALSFEVSCVLRYDRLSPLRPISRVLQLVCGVLYTRPRMRPYAGASLFRRVIRQSWRESDYNVTTIHSVEGRIPQAGAQWQSVASVNYNTLRCNWDLVLN